MFSVIVTTSLSISVENQDFSSSTWDFKKEEKNMIINFIKEYEVKYEKYQYEVKKFKEYISEDKGIKKLLTDSKNIFVTSSVFFFLAARL